MLNSRYCTTPARRTSQNLDRFIPRRQSMDIEAAHFTLVTSPHSQKSSSSPTPSSSQLSQFSTRTSEIQGELPSPSLQTGAQSALYRRRLSSLSGGKVNGRILPFTSQSQRGGLTQETDTVYRKTRSTRYYPDAPLKVLDMPSLVDDLYTNVMDWGSQDVVAVGLRQLIHCWCVYSDEYWTLPPNLSQFDWVTSVASDFEGYHLAVGTQNSLLQVWDVPREQLVYQLDGPNTEKRIGALAWAHGYFVSGRSGGLITVHDPRAASVLEKLIGHSDVYSLCFSPDERYLATAHDNGNVHVWSVKERKLYCSLMGLVSPVKALGWCPWQPNILAGGALSEKGGNACVVFWDIHTNKLRKRLSTRSNQIPSLVWSDLKKEVYVCKESPTSHVIDLYSYPALKHLHTLKGHTGRILGLAFNPDGDVLGSLAADETFQLWKCYSEDDFRNQKPSIGNTSPLIPTIR